MVNKSWGHKNAVISENRIKLIIVTAHRKLIFIYSRLCELTFNKVLQKRSQVQKLYEENTEEKPVKMTKIFGFWFATGVESPIPAMFFQFPIDYKKRLFSKKRSTKSEHWQKRNLGSKFQNESFWNIWVSTRRCLINLKFLQYVVLIREYL